MNNSMIDLTNWYVEARRRQNIVTGAEVPVNGCRYEKDDAVFKLIFQEEKGVYEASIEIEIRSATLTDVPFLRMDEPVRVSIPVKERPERITAYYMFNPWWTRPAFTDSLNEIPCRTQVALFKMKDRCVCFLPMVGKEFRTSLKGGSDDSLILEMTAGVGNIRTVSEPLFLMGEAETAAEAVQKVFFHLARKTGMKLRRDRQVPEMFKYLGWCTWDAFYTEVSEEQIREKAKEIEDKNLPFRWILIDDGWFSAKDKMIADLRPDKDKFPNGFKTMTEDIRRVTSVEWFGVWHALGGYWDGIAPGSLAEKEEAGHLYRNYSGTLIPDPVKGAGFYRDWYELLRRDGIDFVKVDGQSAVPFYYKNGIPIAEAARNIAFSLESGTSLMNGALINCMGMAMENIVARPGSAISRNSDDFLPLKEESFAEHLIQNAYNAVYHNQVYCCDWDMFWTNHKHAQKHALLRAISGGPVYVSDRNAETDPEVLRPLAYADGRLLMLERAAMPTEDCMFTDPAKEGVLKLHNCGSWGHGAKAGGAAVYNLTDCEQSYCVSPEDVPELAGQGTFWIYDYLEKRVRKADLSQHVSGILAPGEFKWLIFLPKGKNSSCLGLSEKYVGFTAVESMFTEGETDTVILKGCGSVSWISGKVPLRVTAGAQDVTGMIESKGLIHKLPLPESGEKTVITVTWKDEK